MAKCEKSYEGLHDLLIREQIISKCSTDMALFLRERAPSSVSEMVTLGEQYMEAHGGTIGKSKQTRTGTMQYSNPNRNAGGYVKPATVMPKLDSMRDRLCFFCSKKGHIARDCLLRQQQSRGPRQAAGIQIQGELSGSTPYENSKWKSAGYTKPPYKWRKSKYQNQNPSPNEKYRDEAKDDNTEVKRAAACQDVGQQRQAVYNCIEDGYLKLADGSEVPVISGACDGHRDIPKGHSMPVHEGLVGIYKVQVLRDTGCSSAAVRESFVKPEQLLDREHLCVLIDGTVRRFRMANIHVDTPFYTGSIDVMCMKQPIYDLILGNVAGVLDVPDDDWHLANTEEASVVKTRAQTQK